MQFLDEVVFMPVACRQLGSRRAENYGFSQLQSARWSMSLLVQFIDGCGCPCVFAVTVGLLLEVPHTQFITGADGLSSCRVGVSSWVDGDEGVGAHHTGDELNQPQWPALHALAVLDIQTVQDTL